MGAEDFSLYAREVPGLFFFVGATSAGIDPATAPSNHSSVFLLDEKALDVGLRSLLQGVAGYLTRGRRAEPLFGPEFSPAAVKWPHEHPRRFQPRARGRLPDPKVRPLPAVPDPAAAQGREAGGDRPGGVAVRRPRPLARPRTGWLDAHGKPCAATATLQVPHDSANLIESKSLKLYLNSLNSTRFNSAEAVRESIATDLSARAGAPVTVEFGLPPVDAGALLGAGAVLDRRAGRQHRRLRPAQCQPPAQAPRRSGGGNPGLGAAEIQLPGYRSTGLGQHQRALSRRADRPGGPAAPTW